MNKTRFIVCALALVAAIAYAQAAQHDPRPEKVENDNDPLSQRVGYAIGFNLANELLNRGFDYKTLDVDLNAVSQGLLDTLQQKELKYTPEQCIAAIEEFEQKRMKLIRETGERFLASNRQAPGVKTTESGLQYKVIQEGDGPKPNATDIVIVHYHGTFIDGRVFDSSVERGEPEKFPLNRVIPGWTEGVQLMNVGSKYQLFIPYQLAYGEKGRPPAIAPCSVLIFEVELLGIE